MNVKTEIALLWQALQHRDKWYVDFSCPEDSDLYPIIEKAKAGADIAISQIGERALLNAYIKWHDALPPVQVIKGDSGESYYDNFLNDLAYDLGAKALSKKERDKFFEVMNLKIKWL